MHKKIVPQQSQLDDSSDKWKTSPTYSGKVSMAVTTIQTTQMLAGVCVSYVVYRIKTETDLPCQQSMVNLYLAFLIYATFAVLFVHFFYKAYIAKAKKSKAE
ncbi:GNS1/SUR4 family protein [Oesophagostomum dentatum]|uniref:GNS1/SUR4 family protein n=1 Tax=Oesophagostomum dentatum TaxID=61180 RepID=A0A0B1SW20_OESDE|nr:GNS1/SUR4 family protein [Oesophagostomum dentatum]